jgi:uncharacterized membrane protein
MSTRTQARPLFAAKLTPRRALGPRGRNLVLALTLVLMGLPGLLLLPIGTWPVALLMGFAIVAIGVALALALRRGHTHETVTLWPYSLELRKVDAQGRETVRTFKPSEVRFVIDRDFNQRPTGVWLKTRTDRVALGAFLTPDEKASFSKVFGTALRKARA